MTDVRRERLKEQYIGKNHEQRIKELEAIRNIELNLDIGESENYRENESIEMNR